MGEPEPDAAEMDEAVTVTTGRPLPGGPMPSGERWVAVGRMIREVLATREARPGAVGESFPAPGPAEGGP